MTRRYLYRQDIAEMLDVSVYQVAYNEKRWGLLPHKQKISRRCVRYKAAPAIASLTQFFKSIKPINSIKL